MRLGLQVPNFTWPAGSNTLGETFGLIAERAERAGLASLWLMDHFFQIGAIGKPEQEMLEGWTALAYAAGRTNRIRLGTMVSGVTPTAIPAYSSKWRRRSTCSRAVAPTSASARPGTNRSIAGSASRSRR